MATDLATGSLMRSSTGCWTGWLAEGQSDEIATPLLRQRYRPNRRKHVQAEDPEAAKAVVAEIKRLGNAGTSRQGKKWRSLICTIVRWVIHAQFAVKTTCHSFSL